MSTDGVRSQLRRILASREFTASPRISRFLQFTVEEALAGRAAQLKETLVGVSVFDKPADYEARIDPIVRVEARRLRDKLRRYYESEGIGDPIRIEYPRGGYAPVFVPRGDQPKLREPAADRTIVVLPFVNLSAEPDNEYFSDGLTQELIHALTRVHGLRVIAWNTAAQLRGSVLPPQEIGRRLQVESVLQGSVRRSVDRLRINVQLVETATGYILWSETYDRRLSDLFALQEQIARSIVKALQIRLVEKKTPPHVNLEAYHFYLRGRYTWNRRTREGLLQSIVFFERALEVDPGCALAWAGLADAHSILADFGLKNPADGMVKAREAAQRAIALDETLAEAHTSLGFIRGVYDWCWEESEIHYRRAIALNPGYATAHHWYAADLLAPTGRFTEALEVMETGTMLNPLDPAMRESFAYIHMVAGDYDEAASLLRRLQQEAPDYYKAYTALGRTYISTGNYPLAIEMLEKGRAIAGDVPNILSALGQAHAMNEDFGTALHFLNLLESIARSQYVSSTCYALVYIGLGEFGKALEWLERGSENRDLPITNLKVHPGYAPLRPEPRFQALLKKIRLV